MSTEINENSSAIARFKQMFYESKKGKDIQNKLTGFGAAIVIIGAMFKIMHFPGGGAVITMGLITEAFLFVIAAFEPVHMPLDWTKAYPEITHPEDQHGEVPPTPIRNQQVQQAPPVQKEIIVEKQVQQTVPVQKEVIIEKQVHIQSSGGDSGVVSRIDEILNQAKIDKKLLDNFKGGIENFSDSTKKLSESVNYAESQNEYSKNLDTANSKIKAITDEYDKQIQLINTQNEQNQKITSSLSNTASSFDKINVEVNDLAQNISSLNDIYGGMLTSIKN